MKSYSVFSAVSDHTGKTVTAILHEAQFPAVGKATQHTLPQCDIVHHLEFMYIGAP